MGFGPLLLVALLLVAPQEDRAARQDESEASGKPERLEELKRPAPRRAIGGVASITTLSRIHFPAYPDQDHECEVVYVFPDRARWRFQRLPAPGPAGETPAPDHRARKIHYRWGEHLWVHDPGRVDSRVLEADERQRTLLQLELRRVATQWPAELEWHGDGDERRAELEGLGSLVATLDSESGQPHRIESRDAAGKSFELLDSIEWNLAQTGRPWPTRWNLVVQGEVVWEETFKSVESGRNFTEAYFLPADIRRAGGATGQGPEVGIQRITLPLAAFRREPLDEAARADWAKALEAARAILERWQAELEGGPHALNPRPSFALDAAGKPTAVELELATPPKKLPTGWSWRPAGECLRIVNSGLESVGASALAQLRAAVPEGRRAGAPRVVVQLTPRSAGITQLLLPLVEAD